MYYFWLPFFRSLNSDPKFFFPEFRKWKTMNDIKCGEYNDLISIFLTISMNLSSRKCDNSGLSACKDIVLSPFSGIHLNSPRMRWKIGKKV